MWNGRKKQARCGCRRRQRDSSPKVAGSLCHRSDNKYHPCVAERIAGKRLCRRWAGWIRGLEADDFEG